MADNAARLDAAGHLPPGLPVDKATDILLAYSSPQLYEVLIVGSGWDLDRYADFISVGIAAHLAA